MRCSNCFQERSGITPAYPNTPPVCRGCARSLDGAVGWLETHGYGIVHIETGEVLNGAALGVSPPTPQMLKDQLKKLKDDEHTAELEQRAANEGR